MKPSTIVRTPFGKSVLNMAEDGSDKVQFTSGKKEIMFDEQAGRFFETGLDSEECIPEEEFCMIDDESGKKIRLTVVEKERIFLDALQVSIATKCFVDIMIAARRSHALFADSHITSMADKC